MGLEKFRIRDDVKWAHPELEQAYALMGNSVGYAEVLLAKEAAKQWRRVRRYQGYEREQHFKQAMYRKGFDLDDVQSWLDAQDFQ